MMAFQEPQPRPARPMRPADIHPVDQPMPKRSPSADGDPAHAPAEAARAADPDAAPLLDCGLLRIAFARNPARRPAPPFASPSSDDEGGAR
jgi:hypothetical protein